MRLVMVYATTYFKAKIRIPLNAILIVLPLETDQG